MSRVAIFVESHQSVSLRTYRRPQIHLQTAKAQNQTSCLKARTEKVDCPGPAVRLSVRTLGSDDFVFDEKLTVGIRRRRTSRISSEVSNAPMRPPRTATDGFPGRMSCGVRILRKATIEYAQ